MKGLGDRKKMTIHWKKSRKAVAPIIATLLMIAISVIGGVMIYVFTQGFFGNNSITASPYMDAVTMPGYDMQEIPLLVGIKSHEGTNLVGFGDAGLAGMSDDEEGAIYIRNIGQKPYTITKLEVNGASLVFIGNTNPLTQPAHGEYTVITVPDAKTPLAGTTHQPTQTILPGQEGTLLVSFDDGTGASGIDNTAANGRTIPVKITSATGSVYNFNVVIGAKN